MNEDRTTVPAVIPAAQPEIVEPYPLLRPGAVGGLLDVLRDNVGDAGIQALDLPRIKVPSGGSTIWLIQTPAGEESAKTVEGIILAWRNGRLYWKQGLNEGGSKVPPDCVSRDALVGTGDPGGECAHCPFSKFGSTTKGSGKGQACKQIRQLLLVQEDEILPALISTPPSSLKAVSQYFMALLSRGIPHWGVVTKIGLEKATNDAGIAYAKMILISGRVLGPDERSRLAPFQKQMAEMLRPGVIDARDYSVEDDGPPIDDVPF